MAEGKTKIYTKKAAVEAVIGTLDRIQAINDGTADHPYLNHVRDVILFGSLVNDPDSKYVHDADIAIITDDGRQKMTEFRNLHPELCVHSDIISYLFTEHVLMKRYIRGRKYLLSLHSNVDLGREIKNIATSDQHIWLFKDYALCDGAVEELRKLIS